MGRPRSWTDEDLIAAVAASSTLTEVLARLGLSKGGASLSTVRRRMLELGLDAPQILRQARSEKWMADPDDDMAHAPISGRWTEDELRMAVVASTSMRQVMERLGYGGSGGAWSTAKAQILELGLDTSHFSLRRPRLAPPKELPTSRRSWTDDDLRKAVAEARSVAGVIRALNLKVGGSVYPVIQRRIRELEFDTSHFTGQGWSKGKSVTRWPGRPLHEVLVENSTYRSTRDLKNRLIKEGLITPECSMCGLTDWLGATLTLQLDHINGRRSDNRLDNLRLLCPNCHSQTDTWCGRNIGKSGSAGSMSAPASVAKMAYARVSRSRAERHEGSSPSRGTSHCEQLTLGDLDALD